MLHLWNKRACICPLVLSWSFLLENFTPVLGQAPAAQPPATITNLQQLTASLLSEHRLYRDLRLEFTVCAASKPTVGVVIAKDDTGVEWLQLGNFGTNIAPGERLLLRGWHCLLRKRDCGIEISQAPAIDNDGLHPRRTWGGNATLKAGRNPVRLDWFNYLHEFSLEVYGVVSNSTFALSNLCHEVVDSSGPTNYAPGLQVECYEGHWDAVPDFDLLQPVKVGVASNFDVGFRTRDEQVGLRFTGYVDA